MKKNYPLFYALLVLAVITAGSFWCYKYYGQHERESEHEREEREEHENQEGVDDYWKQILKDPTTGEIPNDRLMKAFIYMKQKQGLMSKAAIPGIQWTERGPNNQGGVTRALLIDLNDTSYKTVWAGSAGGLWKTTDITQAQPNWVPVNDFAPCLAISAIAQCKTSPSIMYYGTGFFGGNGSQNAMGIWISLNKGTNWNLIPNSEQYGDCRRIIVLSTDTVLFVTKTGIYLSPNKGTTCAKVLGSGISGAASNNAWDLEVASNGTLYATVSGSIHKSYNRGKTWTNPLTMPISATDRIELALAPSDSNYVYALIRNNSVMQYYLKSTNAGNSFTAFSKNISSDGNEHTGAIAVDPNNPQRIFIGGLEMDQSTDGGTTWGITNALVLSKLHADHHLVVFAPNNSSVVYFCNDGGIYRGTGLNSSTALMEPKNYNYATTQFYTCTMSPFAGNEYFLAGTQDNGTYEINMPGLCEGKEVAGGDGAYCHIDQNEPNYRIASYQKGVILTNYDNSYFREKLQDDIIGPLFINPFDYNDSSNQLYARSYSRGALGDWDLIRFDSIATSNFTRYPGIPIRVMNVNNGLSQIKVSPNVDGRIYLGTNNGRIIKVDAVDVLSGSNSSPAITSGVVMNNTVTAMNGNVSCIEVQKGNENHMLVTLSNYGVNSIWETTNGGTTWNSAEGTLPDMPVHWVLFSPLDPDKALIATELGVWSTDNLNGSSTDWQPSNSGLANVRVTMLKTRPSDNLVIASSFGRGLFSCDYFVKADFTVDKQVIYAGQSVKFTANSANTFNWNFGDGTTLNSIQSTCSKIYTLPGVYTVSLVINGPGNDKVKIKTGYIKVLPWKGTPYLEADGGNFDVNVKDFAPLTISGTGFELGTSSISGKEGNVSAPNTWVTGITENRCAYSTEAYLYTPAFNLSASGVYTLSFKTRYHLNSPNGFRVEYSLDHGKTWAILGDTVAAYSWYNYSNAGTNGVFPQNEPYLSMLPVSPFYDLKSYSFSNLSGNPVVAFRFAFKSIPAYNPSSQPVGFWVDNFTLTGPPNPALNPILKADFTTNKPVAYVNDSIKFTNTSASALSYEWRIGNGPSNTTVFNSFNPPPQIYSASGSFYVYLITETGPVKSTKSLTLGILPNKGVPYTNDFESTSNDFYCVTLSGTGFSKGNPAKLGGAFNGTKAWVTGLSSSPVENSEAYLYTPNYNFSASGSYTISFQASYNFEPYSAVRLEYSLDRGITWFGLGTNTTGPNWYNRLGDFFGYPNSYYFGTYYNTNGYKLMSYTTSALQGNPNVAFRFVFKSINGTEEGFAVDNFNVSGPSNPQLNKMYSSISIPGKNGSPKFITKLIPSANLQNMYYVNGPEFIPVSVSVMASNGQLVKKMNMSVGELMDLSDVSSGIYYCMFTTSDGLKQLEKILIR